MTQKDTVAAAALVIFVVMAGLGGFAICAPAGFLALAVAALVVAVLMGTSGSAS